MIKVGAPFKDWAATIEVKPSWMAWNIVLLQVTVDAEDSYGQEQGKVRICAVDSFPLEAFRSEQDVAEKVRAVLLRLLTHEMDEAIQFKGARVFDPHREERAVLQ